MRPRSKIAIFGHGDIFMDHSDPTNRFIHLDGSRYGSSGLWRIMTTPTVKYGVLLGIFVAAGKALLKPEQSQQVEFLSEAIYNISALGVSFLINRYIYQLFIPINKNAVIDKQGYFNGDPANNKRFQNYLGQWSLVGDPFAAGIIASVNLIRNGAENFDSTYAQYVLFGALWHGYAWWKMRKGDWTVHSNPPSPKRKTQTKGLTPRVRTHCL